LNIPWYSITFFLSFYEKKYAINPTKELAVACKFSQLGFPQ
jgi:hypothetical protein